MEVPLARASGDEFTFLKRTYVWVEEGLLVKPVQYAAKMVKLFEENYGIAKKQKRPATSDIQEVDIVGTAIHLSQERVGLSYVVKELASKMRRMMGYLKETERQHILLAMRERGEGIQTLIGVAVSQQDGLLEGQFAVSGIIVHGSSRSQKTISLRSAEPELNGLVAGACDGICIQYALEFLTRQEIQHVCWIDDSDTRHLVPRQSG